MHLFHHRFSQFLYGVAKLYQSQHLVDGLVLLVPRLRLKLFKEYQQPQEEPSCQV